MKTLITFVATFLFYTLGFAGSHSVQIVSVPGGGAAFSGFLQDTLSASDVALASHSPETGGTWVEEAGDAITVTTTGASTAATSSYAVGYNDASGRTSEDYTATAKGKTIGTSDGDVVGACVRIKSDFDAYCVMVRGDNSAYLIELNNGAYYAVEDGPDSITGFSASTEYTMAITVSGSTLTATVHEGVTLRASLSGSDGTITAGDAGIMVQGSSARVTDIEAEE